MTQWRYALEGQAYGPVSDEVIRSLAYQGVLGPMSNVLLEGSASWTPLYVHETMLGLARDGRGVYSHPGGQPTGSSHVGFGTPPGAPPPPPTVVAPRPVGMGSVPPPPGYPTYAGPYAQAVDIGIPFASWGRRAVAVILDLVMIGIPMSVLLNAVGLSAFDPVRNEDGFSTSWNVGPGGLAISLMIGALYYGVLTGVRGQTLGKMVMHIRVCDLKTGTTIGVGRGLGRWAIQIALGIPCGIGTLLDALWPLWDDRKQAIHDKVAGSVVIRT